MTYETNNNSNSNDDAQFTLDGDTTDATAASLSRVLRRRFDLTDEIAHSIGTAADADTLADVFDRVPDEFDWSGMEAVDWKLMAKNIDAFVWFVDECELDSAREAVDYFPLFEKLEEIPKKVLDVTANPTEWDINMAHTVEDVTGDTLWYVAPKEGEASRWTEMAYVDKWGYVIDEEMFYHVYDDGPYFPANSDVEGKVVYYESFHEYASTATFVDADGPVRWEYDDGVVCNMDYEESYLEAACELANGSGRLPIDGWRSVPTTPGDVGDMARVKSGWHSSMESSDQSRLINYMTRGEFHDGAVYETPRGLMTRKDFNAETPANHYYVPVWGDGNQNPMDAFLVDKNERGATFHGFTSRHAAIGAVPEIATDDDVNVKAMTPFDAAMYAGEIRRAVVLDGPVAVVFGKTSNIFSIAIDIYATDADREAVESILGGRRAAPGHAGVA